MTPDELRLRLNKIESRLDFFARAYETLHNEFVKGVHVKIDSSLLKPSINLIKEETRELSDLLLQINEVVKSQSLPGTVAFMAKKLNEMEQSIASIKENGIKKNIHLSLTMDGYEMVRRRKGLDDEYKEDEQVTVSPDQSIKNLFNTIQDKYHDILIHRYGLFGESAKTLKKVGEAVRLSPERVRQIEARALRLMRHPSRKNLVDSLDHVKLKKAIMGG